MPATVFPSKLFFPENFTFGTAVSSFQVENPDPARYSDWDAFIHNNPSKKIIRDGQIGPDWWDLEKAKRDIDVMQSIGTTSLRLSLEWARIEPQPGVFNPEAVIRYKELITFIKDKGMAPIVTLNHFALPKWVADMGSWSNRDIVKEFEKYTDYVLSFLPDIPFWITLNEPNLLAISGYLSKYFPPQMGSIIGAGKARFNMIEAHEKAYRLIKSRNEKAKVGIAFSFLWYRPENETDRLERMYTYMVNYLNSTSWVERSLKKIDFIGCNYYTGYYLNLNPLKFRLTSRKDSAGIPKILILGQSKKPDAYSSDMGWPIVPDFFLSLLRNLYNSYKKPILITENGIADVHDKYRAFYILTHLVALWKILDEKIPVIGYNYWSTIDNLEWLYGYSRNFGLISYDTKTKERHIRRSSKLYENIIKNGHINIPFLLNRYIPEEQKRKAELLITNILTAGKRTPQMQYQENSNE